MPDLDDEARSLHAWDKRIAVLTERDRLRAELERIRADVTRLCDEAKHYNHHVHKGPFATDSPCVPECRSFAAWTLNPREVQAVLAAAKAGEGS